jgi:hypothetical protein
VLRNEGLFVLVVPHEDGTLDHRRPVTRLSRLIEDFERQTAESDLTYVREILRLHDTARDPGAVDFESFKERTARNVENRGAPSPRIRYASCDRRS